MKKEMLITVVIPWYGRIKQIYERVKVHMYMKRLTAWKTM